ncbi:RNA polymerase sporulation sigma factor SigK [Clostridium estertheticum]|uniref:RNA polymerase sigma factor n=2 Tax=Clostridium estertheticum TaxID=238834 RepID=A0A1J0GK33_9CLOT|nr:RNA polymerase sporulation sigma factor SigK [Clostridium estertheticum]APC41697.1 sporulation sigma factor SigK [Clostridium estertheticum subsp. estertheticum]MBU3073469.1 RNA polymerase sporulation sigma factor SigK [Clostridium estertheticum]MBU3163290.1 RNA polymerase sporulation sigma factor SigK [Clostridium estertheticum]MBU3171631.1 RNA polymerase sporulation sigma factor SigK [Clostridium estertheticum]MBU3185466.1 RNA polymerase sporulation sigma factor SigK [Clostridium esterthe
MFSINSLLDMIGNITFLTAYITGTNSFPQPLSEEEEKYYLTKFAEGDLLAKGTLVERNLRLVAHIVKKYSYPGKDVDDLISIGTVGLIKAIDSFNMNKGIRLATYAARCIENEILMLIRSNKKIKREVYLQDPIGKDKEGKEVSLMDVLRSEEDSITDIVENKIQIKRLYSKINVVLKEREKVIIQMRYGLLDGKPRTQREIALILGISRSYISRIEKRVLKKLNKELGNNILE